MTTASSRAALAPLVLATMASQALLVVLGPTIVAIGDELGAPVGVVGQARSIAAGAALAASGGLAARSGALDGRRLLAAGAGLAIVACAAVATAPTLAVFLTAHLLVGLAFACLLSAGFAGVSVSPPPRRGRAMGYVAAANAGAWILINPMVGLLTGWMSWRVAQAVPAVIAVAALLAARTAAPVPARRAARPLRAVLGTASARRWLAGELIAYGAWTAFLTFSGAFFIETLGVRDAAVGWVLAAGPAAYVVTATRSGRLTGFLPRRRQVAVAALVMALLLPVLLAAAGSVASAVALCVLIGFAAGVRTPASAGLGLDQLPDQPGAMMAARTAVTQLGYLLGATVGGALIAGAGYAWLGLMLAAGLAASALLALRVTDPLDQGGDPWVPPSHPMERSRRWTRTG
ncbi:MFS transporter [Pseudonocardia asaccharolytica]|nr:MFS transporter [Pseudonocardia asaccharolytica]